MIINKKPGVYSSYTVAKESVTTFAQKACAVVLKDDDETKLGLKIYDNITKVKNAFETDVNKLKFISGCEILFSMGVKKIYCVLAKDENTIVNALSLLENKKDIGAIVLDEELSGFAKKVDSHCKKMSSKQKERFFIVGSDNVNNSIKLAENLNSERAVVTAGKGYYKKENAPSEFYLACLLAGICLSMKHPNESLALVDTEVLDGLEENPTDDEISLAIDKGVTVFEELPYCVSLIKALTTRVKSGDLEDRSFTCLTTVITVDYIMESIRNMLYTLIKAKKLSGVSYDSISSQVCVLLSEFVAMGLLSSFEIPNIYRQSSDSSVCVVDVKFKLLPCVDTIHLSAEILV